MTEGAVLTILANLSKIGASEGGLAILANLFTEHGLTPEKVEQAAAKMPVAPAPKE